MHLTLFYENFWQYKLLNIKVTTQWEDEQVVETLTTKTEDVSYCLRKTDQYEDQLKDILNSIHKEDLADSDSESTMFRIEIATTTMRTTATLNENHKSINQIKHRQRLLLQQRQHTAPNSTRSTAN